VTELTDLTDLLEAAAGPPAVLDPARVRDRVARRQRERRGRYGVGAGLAVVVIVVIGLAVARPRDNGLDVGGSSTGAGPAGRTASVLVFLSSDGLRAMDPATGAVSRLDVGGTGRGCMQESCPVYRVGTGVVFVANGHAYALADLHGRPVDLGSAAGAYPAAEPGTVWLAENEAYRRVDVATGRVLQSFDFPSHAGLASAFVSDGIALPEGIVYYGPGRAISVWNPATASASWTSPVDAVWVEAASTRSGSLLAWMDHNCAGAEPMGPKPCALHLTDLTHGTERTVPIAAGTLGYFVAGRFSPDGRRLAAFSYSSGDGSADLTMIDVSSGTPSVIPGSHLDAGTYGFVGTDWSPDGSRVFFTGGPAQPVRSFTPGDPAAVTLGGSTAVSFVALPIGSGGPAASPTPTNAPATSPTGAAGTIASPGTGSSPGTATGMGTLRPH
jgi:hypothetical protein